MSSNSSKGRHWRDPLDPVVKPIASAAAAAYVQTDRISMITAETRLARRGPDGTGWVIGLSLLHNEARVNRLMDVGPLTAMLTGVRNQVDEQTLYGETSVEPVDRLTLTFGGRLTHSRSGGRFRGCAPRRRLQDRPGREQRPIGNPVPALRRARLARDRSADPVRPLPAGLSPRRDRGAAGLRPALQG